MAESARAIGRRILSIGGWGQRSFGPLPNEPTESEELANSLTGAVGLLASVIAVGYLLEGTLQHGQPEYLLSALLYGATLVLSFAATTLYHGARCRFRKQKLRVLDHCAVFALIAGSYTPVAVVGLGGRLGWGLFAGIWAIAGAGILFKLRVRFRYPGTSVLIYLAMGWIGVLTIRPVIEALGFQATALLAAGGLAYTIGTIFFGAKRMPYNHAVWHLLVILGSACHYAAITSYVLAPAA